MSGSLVCRWIYDNSVPGGRFHVPGCWGTIHDPYGNCLCEKAPPQSDTALILEKLSAIETRLEMLEARKVKL